MKTKIVYTIYFAWLVIFYQSSFVYALTSGDREWWKNNYKKLIVTSDQNHYVERANKIFDKILATAGYPDNKNPELIVIKRQNKPWAIALNDGAVILSEFALNLCYNEMNIESGDSRLAFVLGHEIAHIINKNFWHLAAFKTIEDSNLDIKIKETLSKIFNEKPIERRKKEIQADSDGLLFSIMSGYDINYLNGNNFFEEWVAQMPKQDLYCQPIQKFWCYINNSLGFNQRNNKYPTPKERSEYLKEYANSISDNVYKFHFGVKLYELGKYDDALNILKQFQDIFYGREVQNIIGLLYYREALNLLSEYDFDKAYRFKLANIISWKTRATKSTIKRGPEIFKRKFKDAIRKLKKAIEKDPDYLPAIVNYSSMLVLKEDYIDAELKINEAFIICSNRTSGYTLSSDNQLESITICNNHPYIQMNSAIIKYKLEKYEEAIKIFDELKIQYPNFSDLYYNYGRLLFEKLECKEETDFKGDGKCNQVAELWRRFLDLEKTGVYASIVRQILTIPAQQEGSYTQGFLENPTLTIGESARLAKKKLTNYKQKEHKTGTYYYKDNKHIIVIKNEVTLEIVELKSKDKIKISKIYSQYKQPSRQIKHKKTKTLIYKNFAVDVDSDDMVRAIIYF